MDGSNNNKPKKVLLISSRQIPEQYLFSFKLLFSFNQNSSNSSNQKNTPKVLFLYTSNDQNTNNIPEIELREYLIFKAKNLNFYIWVNEEDNNVLMQNNISKLTYCCDHYNDNIEKNKSDEDNFSNDIILFLYLLFDESILQSHYSYYYKIIIKIITKFLMKYPNNKKFLFFNLSELIDQNNFSDEIKKVFYLYARFFQWLHEIEPSVLYSFYLLHFFSSFKQILKLKDKLKIQLKMPSLYFTPYFLQKVPELENTIQERYCEIKNNNFTMYLITIFPFYSKKDKIYDENEADKINVSIDDFLNIIVKGRINQSSYVSEFVIKCFKNQVYNYFNNIDKTKINNIFDPNYQQNSLAIEESPIIKPYCQIDQEQDENCVYFGLPGKISIRNKQDYYIFNSKKVYLNYPLFLMDNAKVEYQNNKIMNCFSLDQKKEDKLKFIFPDNDSFEEALNYKGCYLFQNLLKKYSDDKVPLQYQETNQNKEIFNNTIQSIFDNKKCIEFYKRPLTFQEFAQELEKFYSSKEAGRKISIKTDNLNLDEFQQSNENSKDSKSSTNFNNDDDDENSQDNKKNMKRNKTTRNKSNTNFDDDDDDDENSQDNKKNMKRNKTTRNKSNTNFDDDDDDDENSQDNKKNMKRNKTTRNKSNTKFKNNNNNNLSNSAPSFSCKQRNTGKNIPNPNKKKISKNSNESSSTSKPQLLFISDSKSHYFFIDSVSNFIDIKYEECTELFLNQQKIFDYAYIREQLYKDMKISEPLILNNMHVENIIKMSLFGSFYKRFRLHCSKFLSTFEHLSKDKILLLYILYKVEDKDVKNKVIHAFEYIQTVSDIKVQMLKKLYFCSSIQIDESVVLSPEIKIYVKPPPHLARIMLQFRKEINSK